MGSNFSLRKAILLVLFLHIIIMIASSAIAYEDHRVRAIQSAAISNSVPATIDQDITPPVISASASSDLFIPNGDARLDFERASVQDPLIDHFPLAIGNLWEYSRKLSIDNDTRIYPITCQITGTATISGVETYIMRKEEIEDEDHFVQNDYLAEAEGEFRKYACEHVEGNVPGPHYTPEKPQGYYYLYCGKRFDSVGEIMDYVRGKISISSFRAAPRRTTSTIDIYDSPRIFLRFPITVGDSWISSHSELGTFSRQVVDVEQVAVPAGSFTVYKIEVLYPIEGATWFSWYGSVGLIKSYIKVEDIVKMDANGNYIGTFDFWETCELESFAFTGTVSISGELTYSGQQTGQIIIQASTSPTLETITAETTSASQSAIEYTLILPPDTYYLRAFMDADADHIPGNGPEANEPIGFYGTPDPISVQAGQGLSSINFALSDPFHQAHLKEVIVYPNPYRPESGTKYDAPAITFENLTAQATIKIYDIAGELVKTIEETNADGKATWDGKNETDRKAASGVYIYLITSPDVARTTGKLAIIK